MRKIRKPPVPERRLRRASRTGSLPHLRTAWTTAPSRNSTMRWQRRAVSGSWVTSSSVSRSRALNAKRRSRICPPVGLVEVAGRLIGENDVHSGGERAGDGDTLLLAPGKFARIVREPVAEADGLKFFFGPGERLIAAPLSSSGMATFSSAVMVGDQVKRLEYDAEPVAAKTGELILVHAAEIVAVDEGLAAG